MTDTKKALSADLERVQTELDQATARVALLEKRAAKAIEFIEGVAPQTAIAALTGDYDADL